jgi:molecular chaperone Hsp33
MEGYYNMEDYILRATTKNGDARVFFATSTNTVNDAYQIHKTFPVASVALGRLLTAGAIMGSMLKNENDLLTISIKGNGPMKGLMVTSDNKARVKGYVNNPLVDIPLKPNGNLDVRNAVGEGFLNIIQDTGMKSPYVGQIPLVSGEIADDLTYYYAKSEQIPTAVALGVLVDKDYTIKHAGGFIIQMMPNADEDVVTKLEQKMQTLPPLTQLFEKGVTPEDLIEIMLGEIGYTITDKIPMQYYCNCSKDRVEKALLTVGIKELKDILLQDKRANLNCHFCNTDYEFTEEDLKTLIHKLETQI